MSTTGAGLLASKQLGEVGDTINVETTVQLAHIQRFVSLTSVIRSKQINMADTTTFNYGIEFKELTDEDYILTNSYIYMQLVDDQPLPDNTY